MNINLTAPFCDTSYGLSALNTLKELTTLGHEVAAFPIGDIDGRSIPLQFHKSLQKSLDNAQFFDADAPSVRLFHQFSLAQHVGRGKRIGWPIFELDKFNELELHHLRAQDELIVCSHWAAEVCRVNGLTMPIHVVPLGVDTTIFSPAQSKLDRVVKYRSSQDPPGASFTYSEIQRAVDNKTTVFINVGKKELRKGHDIILECFEKAFTHQDNVELWMVWGNRMLDVMHPNESKAWTDQYMNSALAKQIKTYEWLPLQSDVVNLFHLADCAIFPSRAEGFNLDLLEAMACGLPVIATSFSAHQEYISNENSYIIPIDKTEIAYDGIWFHGQGSWAHIGERQKNIIVDYMKNVHARKQRGDNLFNQGGIETACKFSWLNTAEKLISCIS